MKAKIYFLVTGVFFTIVAVLQCLRFLFKWEVIALGYPIPYWPNAIAFFVLGYLAWAGFRLYRKDK